MYENRRKTSWVENGVLYLRPALTTETIPFGNITSGTYSLWGSSPADTCTSNEWWGCERTANVNATPKNIIPPITSARLRTRETFNFTYGRVEVRAKLPKGDWIWPAIWMLPTDQEYGTWPASGEIDIMESRGNAGTITCKGHNSFVSTLHWGPDWS